MKTPKDDWKPADPGRVNAIDPVELDYWCRTLGCSAEQLNAAIDRVGDHVTAVREELQRSRGTAR